MPLRYLQRTITVEHLMWALLIIAAAASRLWDLGSRTLHHDETIHTYYSWRFAELGDYAHFPLGHGPFLYHANAAIYALFGATDVTSRILPAIVGVLLVWLPWLLRGARHLGRWGALAAGFMLLISPAFLYYTRFIRHDPYMAAGSLLLVIAVFRYLERPKRRWIIAAFASVGFLLANHELIFATFLGMVIFLWGALLVTRLRPLIPVHIGAVVLLGIVYALFFDARPWPQIPWNAGDPDPALRPTPENQRRFYADLFDHPMVLGVIIVAVMFLVACAAVIWWQANQSRREGSINDRLFGDALPGTITYGVHHALKDWPGLLIGATVSVAIFVLLFSSLFTNMHGLATGTWATDGTLLYWLGQHDVQRGKQPWFYFITLGFQYEWLGILLATAGLAVVALRCIRAALGKTPPPNLLFAAFCAWWFVCMFLVLSWAGEKMPWLIMHFALPAFLVGGILINEIAEGWGRDRRPARTFAARYGAAALVASLVVLATTWFLMAAEKSWGRWPEAVADHTRRPGPEEIDPAWWHLALPPLGALLLIALAAWRIGTSKTAYATIAATFVIISAGQVHQGFRAAFVNGDSARETLIYNTISPDVSVLVGDLNGMSANLYGDRSLTVTYDRCTEWPLNWYLRDFPNRQVVANPSPPPTGGPDIVIGAYDLTRGCEMPDHIPGYTTYTYLLRWHEPETRIYRRFAIAPEIPPGSSAWLYPDQPHGPLDIARSIGDSLRFAATQEGQLRLIRLVLYRELPAPVMPYEFHVYVRNDLVPLYIDHHFGS